MYPLPLQHWVKWLGNISAVILVVGGVLLLLNRMRGGLRVGSTSAFDRFFLGVVIAVIATGVLTELARFVLPPVLACGLYVLHLGVVMTLFVTFPYSKFAHLLYRTLAMIHQRMVDEADGR
jgi:quinone-modifying oxidoreductase subunit QmoC